MQQTPFHAYYTARMLDSAIQDNDFAPVFASSGIEIYPFQIAAASFALLSNQKGAILCDEAGMLDRTEYENYWYAFQKKLDKLLDERNMSYRELSIKLGKSPGYIHDILSRRIDPSTISLFAMAAYFNCSIWDFLNITK